MVKAKRARSRYGTYKHKRLCHRRNEIRLIRLKAAKAVRDVVHCDVFVVPLEHAPRFEAISYAWGNTSDLRAIGVNADKHMLVSKSLESALRYLRYQGKERLLWADAICINQKDIPEKNQAVAKMHLVYQRADRAIVWLGSPSHPWSFQPILDALEDEETNEDLFTWRCQILTKPHRRARAIQGFAKLQWFFRGWVVQETCFAREVIGQYGKHAIPWPQIERMVERLTITARGTMSGIMRPEGRLILRLIRIVSTLRSLREHRHKMQPMDLARMMAFSRTRMTSDPRDKVFAFVNLLSNIPSSLQPDYDRSTPGLFREVCRLLLDEIGLKLLAECEAPTNTGPGISHCSMPSWVPDWSYTRRCEPFPGGLSLTHLGKSYHAGSYRPASFVYPADSAILHLTGSIFATIVFLEPGGQNRLSDGSLQYTLWKNVTTRCQEAAAGTLLSSFTSSGCPAFTNHILRMEHLDRTFEGEKTDDLEIFRRARWPQNMRRVDGRSILLTSNGHLGWAPPAAVVGDFIAVFPGCHVPLVLRRVHVEKFIDVNLVEQHDACGCTQPICGAEISAFYRIIGEAYVQGIMEGEALVITDELSRDNKLQEIAIV
ncbi:hypothetical protein GJ744_003374 [Endocarpon pusillum]|uniref:Heterokaryon incompatibility domain-containing protein n=1 Tax=Endocarpon pusillum TaxID=364733 RepID=A0A8H7E252_9EURO|nr:hypothetical protein GJ744_003374 [Endocarpon pusillum]